ncbi:polysaccharide pyruvyl transferase family protein [uncultured Draconibacterium sp.]|uniref:polysaccharide pyruvyl transferase family protein n=1 Tax=uncultured Draconibacterium sp. TaxID=1573823 RepID=UPI0029C7EFF3|nr:polysaccharide pyruvyl transferase family protein [uncultured Draconibacterium sp.]
MKRIGILSLQKVYNFGASLQLFALQLKLKEFKFKTEIIDLKKKDKKLQAFKNIFGSTGIIIYYIYNQLNTFRRYLINVFMFRDPFLKKLKSAKSKFDEFESSYLTYSKPICSLSKLNNRYNKIIVGSDQVLNPTLRYDNQPFLLESIDSNIEKYTYAASMGIPKIPDALVDRYNEALARFTSISVREIEGLTKLKDSKGNFVSQHIDPTFLFCKDEWISKLNLRLKECKPYILSYTLGNEAPESLKICKEINKQTGFEVIQIGRNYNDINISGITTQWGVGPQEFLELILNASYMVTNSFHGISFCINFGVPFTATLLKTNNRTSRIDNILSIFNLRNRKVQSFDDFTFTENIFQIDNEQIEIIRKEEEQKSLEYLKKIFL